jgi:hypothetical protein
VKGQKMSTLSIIENGRPHTAVGNIYVFSPLNEIYASNEIIFEIFEKDAAHLKRLIGLKRYYYLNSEVFCGQLNYLEPCKSTHPGLALCRNNRILRGTYEIFKATGAPH